MPRTADGGLLRKEATFADLRKAVSFSAANG